MCGIAGAITHDPQVASAAVARMIEAQRYRGPDGQGQECRAFGDRFLALGHNRLAVLDLSAAGREPMIHPQTGDILVYNGELYNFAALRRELRDLGEQFIGTGDAEVVLHALSRWGPGALARFCGMFALAFLDARGGRLILARDPMGIKPLYVAQAAGALVFASQVRTVLASGLVPRKLDPGALGGLLAYAAVPQPRTIVQGVRCFGPGHYQVIDSRAAAPAPPVAFWTFPAAGPPVGETEAAATIGATLDQAVREHLVSDVPVGLFLSSGLDSTIVAGLAARHAGNLRSFTVGLADNPQASEHELAAETAKLLGLRHTAIQVGAADAEEAAGAWLNGMDQPSYDGLNVFIISKAVRARGITVALSGQGGDELFGGYTSFADVPRVGRALRRVPRALGAPLMRALSTGKSTAVRQKLSDMARSGRTIGELYLHRRRAMSDAQLAALGVDAARLGLTSTFLPPEAAAALAADAGDVFWTLSQLESVFYQQNVLLRDIDSNSMAHALEVRVPMLDRRMLDYVLALPGAVRAPPRAAPKHLLRAAFGELLRPALLEQTKRGFALPLADWMLGPLRQVCTQGLAALKECDVLRPAAVDQIWDDFLVESKSPLWSRALTLAVAGVCVKQLGLGS